MEFSRPEFWSGYLSLLQGIFPTQGSNPGLLHYRQMLYQLSYQGKAEGLPSNPCFIIYYSVASHFKMQWLKIKVYSYFSWLCDYAELKVRCQVGLRPPQGPQDWLSTWCPPGPVSREPVCTLARAPTRPPAGLRG